MTVPPLTRDLAAFAAGTDVSYAGGSLRRDIGRLVADYLGVALRGIRTRSAEVLAQEFGAVDSTRPCTVIGTPLRAEPAFAAMTNAIAAHSIELDDVDHLALFHFSPPVVSAALAVAEQTSVTGRVLVDAVTVGCEVMARLSATLNPRLRDRGFHTTPVCGVFGATAAAARLLGADAATMASAFGLAGAQAGGLMQMYGPSMQKRFNPGPAARDGVLSAALALRGFEGADDILEGQRGVVRAFTSNEPDAACLEGLDEASHVEIEFKAYACARPIHNAIDAGLAVRDQLGGQVDGIESIRLERHPDWADYHVIPEPRTYHEAQVSVNYGLALALTRGDAFFDDFVETVGVDESVAAMSRLVEVVPEASLSRGVSCRLTVRTDDGAERQAVVDHPRGSAESPMGDEGLERKFRKLSGGLSAEVLGAAWTLASSAADWSSVPDALAQLPVTAEQKQVV